LLLPLAGTAAAGSLELKTVELASEAVRALCASPVKGIPPSMLREAAGIAVIPHVVKVGFLFDGRFGHGVILVHQPDGCWGNPVFVTLTGRGLGGQLGVEATDLVLIFKTKSSLERALKGKLTLGADVTAAAGPLGREAEVVRNARLRAEVYSYSRSRGLFAGVALQGDKLHVDAHANEVFYGIRKCRPEDVLARRGPPIPAAEAIKAVLGALSGAPPAPPPAAVIVPVPPPPSPRR
jgi:lipid-binding SYLF domain-containing protein